MKKELRVNAIRKGTVIDHVPSDVVLKVVEILKIGQTENSIVTIAMNLASEEMGTKGIVKVGEKTLTQEEVDKIALIAPKATVNIIENYEVIDKKHVHVPDVLKNVVKCSNPQCITNHEKTNTKFFVKEKDPIRLKCHYCERTQNNISLL